MNSERQLKCIELQAAQAELEEIETRQRVLATVHEHVELRRNKLRREIHELKERECAGS